MTNANESPRIAEVGYKISLMRVAPGAEGRVANKLAAAVRKRTKVSPICTLKLFGLFDLCTIYETTDYEGGPSKEGPIEGIRGGNKILAFRWMSGGNEGRLNIEGDHGNVWGLLFFRFNEALAKKYGARIESALVRRWNEDAGAGDVVFDIFGTTGWAELLFVIRGKRFADVTGAFAKISEQKVQVGNKELFAPAKTFSLIGVDFELTQSGGAALEKEFSEPFKAATGVFPVLSVTCPPGSMKKVHEELKRLGPGFVTFGVRDFIFNPQNGTWGGFIKDVVGLRSRLPNDLYSTAVGILVEGDGVFGNPGASRLPKRSAITYPTRDSELFGSWGPAFENRLRNLHFGLSNLLQDPLVGDCFEDLRPFVAKRFPLLLRSQSPKASDDQALIDDLIDVTVYGAEERAHGAFLALEHLESSLSPTKGGIQRILQAASYIPRQLLRRVKKDWYGFLVAGYRNAYFHSHYEIINLPLTALFHPEEWFGLLHEAGHAALFDTKFLDMDAYDGLISRAVNGADKGSGQYYDFKNLLFEVGADLFDFYLCFGDALDRYLKYTIPCFLRESKELKSSYLSRCLGVFTYHKYFVRQRRDDFPKRFDHRQDLEECVRAIKRAVSPVQVESGAVQRAAVDLLAIIPFIRDMNARLKHFSAPRDLAGEVGRKTEEIVNVLLQGQVYCGTIEAPDALVLALKEKGELRLDARLAAIASLWNSAVKGAPE